MAPAAAVTAAATETPEPTSSVPLTDDPFKAHILDYDYFSDEEDFSDEDEDDDEEWWADLEEEYNCKEDEDVAVFRAIIDNLPIESLLHLLQGHISAMQREGKLVTTVEVYENKKGTDEGQEKNKQEDLEEEKQEQEAPAIEKKFRWALNHEEVADDDNFAVKSEVHEVEILKDYPDIWFTGSELSAIRHDLVRQIKFFVRHHPERIEVLDRVIVGDGPEPIIEEDIKELTRNSSIGRGLEGHISRLIPETRKRHVFGVLTTQWDCACRMQDYDETSEALRKQSLINGEMMKLYAQRMAKSDEIEAMIAKMSRWEAEDAFG